MSKTILLKKLFLNIHLFSYKIILIILEEIIIFVTNSLYEMKKYK
jgi:hypothetical protein